MNEYHKPGNIKNDMGGEGDALDLRMQGILDLLHYLPEGIEQILDIGYGKGQIPFFLYNRGYKVTSIGLELESYGISIKDVKNKGINLIEADMEKMPFPDESFDCVVASHVLEHVYNFGNAVDEARRVLRRGGVFVVFIPRYTDYVCAGHVNTGWNLGQLIYVLCTMGFDVRKGEFVEYKGSLCAMVKKDDSGLPGLRGDRGDIQILHDSGKLPFIIEEHDQERDGFESKGLKAVNWKYTEIFEKEEELHPFALKFSRLIRKLIGMRRYRGLLHVMEKEAYPVIINPDKVS